MTTLSIPTKTAVIAAASAGSGVISSTFLSLTPELTALITAISSAIITAFISYEESLIQKAQTAPVTA